jgi:hypothetical protein
MVLVGLHAIAENVIRPALISHDDRNKISEMLDITVSEYGEADAL